MSKYKSKRIPLRSKTGQICITDCKEKNEPFVHPVTLEYIKENRNVCAIFPTQEPIKIPQSDSQLLYVDTSRPWIMDSCNVDDNDKYFKPDEIKMMLLTFNFDAVAFLKNVYNIKSFEDSIKWTLENNKLPFDTIKRVHDCTWSVYGKNMENIPIIVYQYYYEIAVNKWLNIYRRAIEEKYSFDIVKGKTASLDFYSRAQTTLNNKDANISRSDKLSDAILTKILTYDKFIETIKKYILSRQENWEEIISHYESIKDYVFHYITEELDKTDILR